MKLDPKECMVENLMKQKSTFLMEVEFNGNRLMEFIERKVWQRPSGGGGPQCSGKQQFALIVGVNL